MYPNLRDDFPPHWTRLLQAIVYQINPIDTCDFLQRRRHRMVHPQHALIVPAQFFVAPNQHFIGREPNCHTFHYSITQIYASQLKFPYKKSPTTANYTEVGDFV